jgi:serine/threonine-protein kinase
MVGQKVGKYNVVSRLGRGGMGTVYKAVDETLGRDVAIKCLNSDLTETESEVLKRFRAEAVALARLNHPNIATIFELTEHEGQLLMVMEFVRGETFEKVSSRLGPMRVDRAIGLCSQVLDALAHAHREGIVHRDLKLANLMLADSGLVKVMDFGLARMAGAEHLTNDGYMVGTPAYMSPEQVLAHEIDGRADLYAMGVVLYRMLTGQLPFKADSGIAMAQKQMYDQPTPVRQLRMELPAAAEDIITRALAKKPEDRFQTADQFKAALTTLNGAVSSETTRTLTTPMPFPAITLRTQPGPAAPPDPETMRTTAAPMAPMAMPHPAAPVVTAPATGSRRLRIAAMAAAGAVLLAAVPATIIMSRGGSSPAPAGVSESATGPVTPSATAPSSTAAPPAPAASPSTVAAPEPSAPPATDPAGKAATVAKRVRESPVAKAIATPAPALPEPIVTAVVPAVTFNKLKLLVLDEGKGRDRDASLRLGADAMTVMDGGTALRTTRYRDVIGVYLSHSREPKWATPDGTAVPIARAGGKFGFLKGTPDWVTVRTRDAFTPLRVPERDLSRVIAELEARVGMKAIRAR